MSEDFRPLQQLATNVTEKVVGRSKNPLARYIGLEHIEPDNPKIERSALASTSVSVNTVFRPGDTLFGKLRPNLRKVATVDFDGYCSTDLLALRALNDVDPAYLGHILRSSTVLRRAIGTAIGTKMPRTSWQLLKTLHVFAPSRSEQRRIAEILDTLDDQIRTTKQILSKRRHALQGLVAETMRYGLRSAPQIESGTIFGRLPEGWEVAPLQRYASSERPYLKTGPFGSSLNQKHWTKTGTPVITIGSLGENRFIHSELLHVSQRTANLLSSYALQPGDIVFSRVADVGRSVAVTESEQGWIMSSNLMAISLDSQRVNPSFLQANIAWHPIIRRQIRMHTNAAGRDVVNGAMMNRLIFAWPMIEEQKAMAQIFGSAQKEIALAEERLEKLSVIKQGLMADLLTGRVRVPVEAES